MNLDFIKNWFIKYNIKDLFLWLQVTAIHPSNQIFQHRFELLLGILFSIPEEKFSGKNLIKVDYQSFIKDFEKKISNVFYIYEDWQPFKQLNLIPYFYNKQKYFFFYSALERPYEFLKQFEEIYIIENSEKKYPEFDLIENLFLLSLEFQTKIIKKLNQIEEAKIKSENIYIPTQKFFNKIAPLFKINSKQLPILQNIPLNKSLVTEKITKENYSVYLGKNLFKTFHIQLKDNNYFLIPQLHLEILYDIANKIIKNSINKEELINSIFNNFQKRLTKKCLQFFSCKKIIFQILNKDGSKNLSEGLDVIISLDSNKIFLYKAVKHCFENSLVKKIKDTIKEIEKIIDTINNQESVILNAFNGYSYIIPPKELQIWTGIVFEGVTLENLAISLKNNFWIINMLDLQRIFESLSSDLSLMKFLKNDLKLLNKSKVISCDYLDRFEFYLSNGESYFQAGIIPKISMFEPHSWYHFYHNQLYKKYQDNIYELIEYDFPGSFNLINHYDKNIYEYIDTGWLRGGLVVKYNKNLIWIMYPDGLSATKDEIKFYSFLGELYAYYLDKFQEKITTFFKKYNFYFQKKYFIALYPSSYIKRNNNFEFLRHYIYYLTKQQPLKIITNVNSGSGNIRSCVIYNQEYLIDLFQLKENIGERFCIKELIESLVYFFDKKISGRKAEHLSENFISKCIPVQEKAFSYDNFVVENPRLDEYNNPCHLSQADIAKVNCEMAEFLAQSEIKPGIYNGDEAKSINNCIFDFLQNKLEDEIKRYNHNIIFYSYKEVELSEGLRENNRLQITLDASKYIEYDIVEKNKENNFEISKLANAAKYIITTLLKVGIKGEININQEGWNYLQAIALALFDTTTISDYIHFNIIPYSLKISELYEIEDKKGEAVFSHEEFYNMESKLQVENAKNSLENREEVEVGDNHFLSLLDKINDAFKIELGFSFSYLIGVLRALGKMNLFSEKYFPLTIITENVLIDGLKKIFQASINEVEIKEILKFVSLNFNTYKDDDRLIPAQLLNKKERLNLCPLISLDTDEYLYGNQMCLMSSKLWFSLISEGYFPYTLNADSPIEKILTEFHKDLDKELEKEAEIIAKKILGDNNVEARIDNFKRLSTTFPNNPACGEIDLLAVNKDIKTIYVLDAKNRKKRMRPCDIKTEIKKFFESRKSYLNKLTEKEEFVRTHLKEILKYFNIYDNKDWKLRKAFVVKINYPIAYSTKYNIDFVLIKDLEAYLKNDKS